MAFPPISDRREAVYHPARPADESEIRRLDPNVQIEDLGMIQKYLELADIALGRGPKRRPLLRLVA